MSNLKQELFNKIEKEIDALLDDEGGGTTSYSSDEFAVDTQMLPSMRLDVNIDGTVELIKTRSVKGKENRSCLSIDVDSDDGSTETLTESYCAKKYRWTNAKSIMKLIHDLTKNN